jgi:MoaA/NifB/PqqE/SkfB family radical SAM enzyme
LQKEYFKAKEASALTNSLAKGFVGLSRCLPLNLRDSVGLPLKPRYVWFETTNLCNSHCVTCNIWQNKPHKKEQCLSANEIRDLLSGPMFEDLEYILNSGGEPTLTNLKEILRAEHQAKPKATLQISSNGLKPEYLLDTVNYTLNFGVPRLEVGLSLDGVGVDHDQVRGISGAFEKLDWLLQELGAVASKDCRLIVSAGSTLTEQTAKSANSLYQYAKKRNISFSWHWFNQSSFYNNGDYCFGDMAKKVVFEHDCDGTYWQMWRKSIVTCKIPRFKCFALKTFFVLKANGDVAPCLSRWNNTVGNVRDATFSKLWVNSKFKQERFQIKNCSGCLNGWGVGWSLRSSFYPLIAAKLKRQFGRIVC